MNENGQQAGRDRPEQPLVCRGVRGATTVNNNDSEEILEATRELLNEIVRANEIEVEDIASIYLTTTLDLNATYPAFAARQLGWYDLALICGHEMDVPDGVAKCIRALIHWNTRRSQNEIAHIYLREAKVLRPDRSNVPPIRPQQMSAVESAMKMLMLTL
jgi:chorismate mutase